MSTKPTMNVTSISSHQSPSPHLGPPRSLHQQCMDLAVDLWEAVQLTPADLPEFAARIRSVDTRMDQARAATVTKLRPMRGGQ